MSIDWRKCLICQEVKEETLKCPVNALGPPEVCQETYKAFLENVKGFEDANSLPVDLKNTGNEIDVACLALNKASWHKSCHLEFSSSKLKKAQERIR